MMDESTVSPLLLSPFHFSLRAKRIFCIGSVLGPRALTELWKECRRAAVFNCAMKDPQVEHSVGVWNMAIENS